MAVRKDEVKGLAGTIVFHALLVLLLLFMALRTPLPLPTEGGVEVNLGNSDNGMGDVQPMELAASTPVAPPPSNATAREEIVTSNDEEAPAIEPKKETKPVVKPEPKPVVKQEPKPVVKQEPTPEPKPKVDPRAMFPGKSSSTNTTGAGGNQGITGKPGDQGKPNGDPFATGYDGDGGSGGGTGGGVGKGVSFVLSGRSSRQIPRPSDNFRESGKVIVTIFVDRSGNVTRTIPGAKGSTTTNTQLVQLADQAAKKAKFSANPDAPDEQKGSITYIFELN